MCIHNISCIIIYIYIYIYICNNDNKYADARDAQRVKPEKRK